MIKDIQIDKAFVCDQDTSIVKVAQLIKDHNVRHVYVVDEQSKPVGVISSVDISAKVVAEGKNPSETTADQVMNSPVDAVETNKEVEFAMNVMMKRKTYSCLVTQEGKIAGAVSYPVVMQRIVSKIKEE